MSESVPERDQLLGRGSSLISEYIRSDESYPDLSAHLRVTCHETCTLSGMKEHDYPPLESGDFSLSALPHISALRKQSFPIELIQQLDQTQFNCIAGVFPDISRVWITVDHRVYLWNYLDGSDLAYFDGLQEVILSVSLSLPKPGVLREHIHYLLSLTTPSNIVVLGVSFEGPSPELLIHPEPLFCLPTDGISLTCVPKGALLPTGRIFFGGKDGCLYEFLYKAKEDWFGGRCKKINHSSSFVSYLLPSFLSFGEEDPIKDIALDTTRHHLFTLSVSGTITLYDMGADGGQMSRVTSLTQDSVTQICCGAAITSDKGLFKPIVSVHTLSVTCSANLHLIALTKSGVRLYFTTTPNGIVARPSLLALVHVRLPPGFSASSSSTRPPRSVCGSYFPMSSPSTFLMSVNTGEGTDSIWIMNQDLFPFQTAMMETRHVLRLPCTVWAVCESEAYQPPAERLPVCATQFLAHNREIIILTASEVYKLYVLRPLDQLKELLLKFPPESEQVSAFFRLLRDGQAAAMCLHLVSDPDQRVSASAAQAFFRYGGDPQLLSPSHPKQTLHPTSLNIQEPLGKAMIGPEVLYSDKLHGLGLYLSRILRPIWRSPLIRKEPAVLYETTFHEKTLELVRERLIHLKGFLNSNPSLRNFPGPLEPISTNTSSNLSIFKQSILSQPDAINDPLYQRQLLDAVRSECQQFESLHQITELSIELLSLLILLSQHQLPLIVKSLPTDQQADLTIMTYNDLILVYKQVTSALLSALLARYHRDERMTEELSHRLLQLTPTLYSADDAKKAKAEECISIATDLAAEVSAKSQRESLLEESLRLLMDVSQQVNLSLVCDKYYQMHFFNGIVDLCLSAAQKLDPDNRAKSYVDNGKPATDTRGLDALQKRDGCYQTIVDYLERSHQPDAVQGRNEQAHEMILTRALSAPEELLHHAMYSHLIESGQDERLVQIKAAYLEVYLRAAADTAPDGDITYLNLLWRHYKNSDNYMAAAKVLHTIANSTCEELRLSERIEFLSRAVICATSQPVGFRPATQHQEFLQEMRDKLEVAQIQLGIQTSLNQLNSQEATGAAARLNLSLLDNTKLYVEFATPFMLAEWRLAILHSSGHQDSRLVEDLWREIIASQFTVLRKDRDTIGLLRKIKELALKYSQFGASFFPLDFILQLMEQHALHLKIEQSELFKCMLESGIAPLSLLNGYHRVYTAKDAFWFDNQAQLYIPQVILSLSTYLMTSQNILSVSERRQVSEWLSNNIPIYLTDLQGLNVTLPALRQMIVSFRELVSTK